MNGDFNWWLLIVGLVIGAGLVWLILADSSRREADVSARERPSEARWIADQLRRSGHSVDDDAVADVLDLHALYLTALPPDEPAEDGTVTVPAPGPEVERPDTGAPPSGGSALADEDGLARGLR
ncbi:MAG TPA: hypothetical protein VID95_05460 [Candidatus Limnocylindrales bacterium]